MPPPLPFFPSPHFFPSPRFLPPRDITIGPDNWLRLCFIACSSLFTRLAAFIFHSFFVCRIEFYGRFDLHAAITPYHCYPAIFFSFYNDLLNIFFLFFSLLLFFAKHFWLIRSLNWNIKVNLLNELNDESFICRFRFLVFFFISTFSSSL